MRHSRIFFFGVCATALLFAAMWRPTTPQNPPTRTLSIYDSTLLTLRDFVAAGDDKLGFADAREIDSAEIDLTQGVRVSFLRNDTARSSFNWFDTVLMDLGRVVYPVYARVNGTRQLRSSITFDSVGGVHPVMFDDSSLILASVQHRRLTKNMHTHYSMVMMPSLGTTATIAHTDVGDSIVATDELRRALGPHFKQRMTLGELAPAVRARSRR
jgi:hypothetical protein